MSVAPEPMHVKLSTPAMESTGEDVPIGTKPAVNPFLNATAKLTLFQKVSPHWQQLSRAVGAAGCTVLEYPAPCCCTRG